MQEAAMNKHIALLYPSFYKARALMLVGAALSCNGLPAVAQERTAAPHSLNAAVNAKTLAHLEDAFWRCDYSVAKGTADRYKAGICGVVIEGIRKEKFNGDIEKLLQWWEQNHAVQHRKLAEQDVEIPMP
jgi:hypothetical protein